MRQMKLFSLRSRKKREERKINRVSENCQAPPRESTRTA
jgi:hypothetical protein